MKNADRGVTDRYPNRVSDMFQSMMIVAPNAATRTPTIAPQNANRRDLVLEARQLEMVMIMKGARTRNVAIWDSSMRSQFQDSYQKERQYSEYNHSN